MELEKAIEILKWGQRQKRLGNLPDYTQTHYQAIETVLNALDNSISKDKIRAKIEELNDKEEELTDDQGYWGNTELIAQMAILEDLLEG